MHFAYPPRKSSNPPPYLSRSSRIPTIRRSRLKAIAIGGLAIIFLIWLFSGSGTKKTPARPTSGKPLVVIVTVFDEKSVHGNADYIKDVMRNRVQYAEKHGYGTHLVEVSDYDLHGAPKSWGKVVAMRHALAKFSNCKYLWYLDQNALIMNPSLKVEDHVLARDKLEASMIKDLPVVPPDSIIKTFSHLKADDVELVITQDTEGLSAGSFIVRNGEWAKFFLDTWFDPLYRSYNFQRAETHALEHIVQWHPTILSKLAVIPQRLINSYVKHGKKGKAYEEGDLAVRFAGCTATGSLSCVTQAEPYQTKWHEAFEKA